MKICKERGKLWCYSPKLQVNFRIMFLFNFIFLFVIHDFLSFWNNKIEFHNWMPTFWLFIWILHIVIRWWVSSRKWMCFQIILLFDWNKTFLFLWLWELHFVDWIGLKNKSSPLDYTRDWSNNILRACSSLGMVVIVIFGQLHNEWAPLFSWRSRLYQF